MNEEKGREGKGLSFCVEREDDIFNLFSPFPYCSLSSTEQVQKSAIPGKIAYLLSNGHQKGRLANSVSQLQRQAFVQTFYSFLVVDLRHGLLHSCLLCVAAHHYLFRPYQRVCYYRRHAARELVEGVVSRCLKCIGYALTSLQSDRRRRLRSRSTFFLADWLLSST